MECEGGVNQYIYRARLARVVDGDTVRAEMDMGFHCYHVESLRVAGVDAPELFSGDNRDAGMASREFVIAWVADAYVDHGENDMEWPFLVRTYKDKQTFGRYVADIVRIDTGESLASALVSAGHAVWSAG